MADRLSQAQLACLRAVSERPLYRQRLGWTTGGLSAAPRAHAPGTVEALARHGLIRIDRCAGCAGGAKITAAGLQAIEESGHG